MPTGTGPVNVHLSSRRPSPLDSPPVQLRSRRRSNVPRATWREQSLPENRAASADNSARTVALQLSTRRRRCGRVKLLRGRAHSPAAAACHRGQQTRHHPRQMSSGSNALSMSMCEAGPATSHLPGSCRRFSCPRQHQCDLLAQRPSVPSSPQSRLALAASYSAWLL